MFEPIFVGSVCPQKEVVKVFECLPVMVCKFALRSANSRPYLNIQIMFHAGPQARGCQGLHSCLWPPLRSLRNLLWCQMTPRANRRKTPPPQAFKDVM
jgi:hypothetical protein